MVAATLEVPSSCDVNLDPKDQRQGSGQPSHRVGTERITEEKFKRSFIEKVKIAIDIAHHILQEKII